MGLFRKIDLGLKFKSKKCHENLPNFLLLFEYFFSRVSFKKVIFYSLTGLNTTVALSPGHNVMVMWDWLHQKPFNPVDVLFTVWYSFLRKI